MKCLGLGRELGWGVGLGPRLCLRLRLRLGLPLSLELVSQAMLPPVLERFRPSLPVGSGRRV